jgi:hypothetical protein
MMTDKKRAVGRLAIMGNIDIVKADGDQVNYPMALLISFDSEEEIRQAIKDMSIDLIHHHDDA